MNKLFLKKTLLILFGGLMSHAYSQINQYNHLAFWYCGDSAIYDTNNRISTLKDLSTKNNNATQSDTLKQPTVLFNQFNGHNTIKFYDDVVTTPTINLGERTEFFLIKRDSASISGSYHAIIGNSGDPYYFLFIRNSNNIYTTNIGPSEASHNINFADNYQVIVRTISASNLTFHTNGAAGSGTNLGAPITNQSLFIGSYSDKYLNGEIAEILVFDTALGNADRQQIETYLYDKYSPPAELGSNITIVNSFCDTLLKLNASYKSYLWSTGESSASISVNKSGKYFVNVVDFFDRLSSDTILVNFPLLTKPVVDTICAGSSVEWNTLFAKNTFTFQWQNNSTDSIYTISQAGQYYVTITDTFGCSITSDTLTISLDNFATTTSLGPDTTLCSGNSIALTSGAIEATSYTWNTGATTNSITIDTSGIYTLEADNIRGCIAHDTITIVISGKAPITNFTATEVCEGSSTSFTDMSSVQVSTDTIKTWLWDFGGGQTSILQHPTYLFPDSGTYNVSLLTSTNNGCDQSYNALVRVNPNPKVGFEVATSPLCSDSYISFSDTSIGYGTNNNINGWQWNMGDGNQYNSAFPNHIYTNSGIYQVKLKVTTGKNCIDSITKSVIVNTSPISNFSFNNACEDQLVNFTNLCTGASTYTWNIGGITATTPNPTQSFDSAYSVPVYLLVHSAAGCPAFHQDTVNVHSTPIANFKYTKNCVSIATAFTDLTQISNDTIKNWNWKFDLAGSSTNQHPNFIFNTTGTFPTQLIVTSGNNCKDTVIKNVNVVDLPQADFSFTPEYGDPPLEVAFSDKSTGLPLTYLWNLGNGDTSILQNPVKTYMDTGSYPISLTVTNNYKCSTTATSILNVTRNYIDVAITNIRTEIDSNNFLNIVATITNLSNRPISQLQLIANPKGMEGFKELSIDTIAIAGSSEYTFSYAPQLSHTSEVDYVCVIAYKPNGVADRDPSNNEWCESLENSSFMISNPYPNPFEDLVTIPVITTESNTISLTIINTLGKKLFFKDYELIAGVNELTIHSANLPPGAYDIVITVWGTDKIYHKKIIKLN